MLGRVPRGDGRGESVSPLAKGLATQVKSLRLTQANQQAEIEALKRRVRQLLIESQDLRTRMLKIRELAK